MSEKISSTTPLVFDENTLRELCSRAMNKGMSLRQNQLSGCGGDKSGQEILSEWLNVVMSRKRAGLNLLD